MTRCTAFLSLLGLSLLTSGPGWASPGAVPPVSAAPAPPLPRRGVVLPHPTLAQLRPLVGRVVRITLKNGERIDAQLKSVWPSALQLIFRDGQSGVVARHRVRSVAHLGGRFIPMATQNAADSGRLFFRLGLGLTLGGLALGGAAPPLFVVGSQQECPGILDCVTPATTAAIFVTTLSAAALVSGVPLWVVGAVRRAVHGRVGAASRRARRRYRAWGMGLTFAGVGLGAVGGALLGVGAARPSSLGALRWAGLSTGAVGIFMALCVGLPMWMEAIRRGSADPGAAPGVAFDPTRDPHHADAGDDPLAAPPRGLHLFHSFRF